MRNNSCRLSFDKTHPSLILPGFWWSWGYCWTTWSLQERLSKYPEMQFGTFLRFDLLVGVLLNRLSWLFLPVYCKTVCRKSDLSQQVCRICFSFCLEHQNDEFWFPEVVINLAIELWITLLWKLNRRGSYYQRCDVNLKGTCFAC